MAVPKIKFKMSIKELTFDFEGDVETGQRMQSELKKTLTSFANTQERLLPPDPNVIDIETSTANGAKSKKNGRTRRPKANTPRAAILALRSDGYFDEKREIGAIQDALATRGRNFKPNELSPALVALTQKKILTREKADGGNYAYEKGPNEDVGGSSEDAE